MKSRNSLLASVVACALLGVMAAGAASSESSHPATQPIEAIITNALSTGAIPGLSIAIDWHGKVIYEKGFGFSDLENHVEVGPETVFPIGSITKTMTGLAVAQLIAADKVELDAPVGRYLPALPQPASNVKIRYLLDHASGIESYTEIPGFPMSSQNPITREEVVRWFASRPLQFPSGTRWSYTNSGFYLLGLVIEAVSGMTYTEYLQKNLFEPFGMTHSSIAGWQPLLEHRAHGYRRGRGGLENAQRYDPLIPFAAGAVLSTAGDLLSYARGVFAADSKVQALRPALLQRDKLPDGRVLPYSLGCLVLTDFEGHRRIGHPGDVFGFAAQYSYYPDDDLTIAILTNSQNAAFPPISIEQKIARVLFGKPQPPIADATLPAKVAARFVGEYHVSDLRFGFDSMAFAVKDGVLLLGIAGDGEPSLPLRYQGGSTFISSIDDEQRIEFAKGKVSREVSVLFYGSPLTLRRD